MADYLLDCSIAYDGPAPVSTYFPVRCEGGVQRATLRGRDLHGRAFKLPESVTGLVRARSAVLSAGSSRQQRLAASRNARAAADSAAMHFHVFSKFVSGPETEYTSKPDIPHTGGVVVIILIPACHTIF